MKKHLFAFAFFLVTPALAGLIPLSWNFNHDAGFGFYQPEGWTAAREGRSSRLFGPKKDFARSEFFFASDWVGSIHTLEDLRKVIIRETGVTPRTREISGLQGLVVGDERTGKIWVLREPTNIILVRYNLRGSSEQIAEGKVILSSVEIRTGGIEYP